MKIAIPAVITSVTVAVLAAACGSSQVSVVRLKPDVKRIEALDNAYGKAHPGLVSCEGSVYATLSESYLFAKKGLQIISPGYIMRSGRVAADTDPVTRKVYAYFYNPLSDYLAIHGAHASGAVVLAEISGQGSGYAVRHGKLRLIPSKLGNACLKALKGDSYPATAPYPTISPETSAPAGCPGSAALATAWKTAPAGA